MFLGKIFNFFEDDLISVLLYGSVVLHDLAPGYGDLDFLAVVSENIDGETARQLIALRSPFRCGDHGAIAQMIEGAFLPIAMLSPAVTGQALWWGTSGERVWSKNELGSLVIRFMKERGVTIWGQELRNRLPEIGDDECIAEIRDFVRKTKRYGKSGELHSVDWLLTAARLILWLRERRYSSKSQAAEWGYRHINGDWRKYLLKAKALRLNPRMACRPDTKKWLSSLSPALKAAAEELEAELEL
jgi:hypothetical protein